jgi:alkylation response protein AidB-like acyl-CoA dehydrogenase
MNFSPSKDQILIKETYARFFSKECPISLVRHSEVSGHSLDLWHKIIETGVLSLGLENEGNSAGTGVLERVLVAEEFGRVLAPIPLLESWVAARCLSRACDAASFSTLENLIGGRLLISLAPRARGTGKGEFIPAGRFADGVLAMNGSRLSFYRKDARSVAVGGRLGAAASALWELTEQEFDLEFPSDVTAATVFNDCLAEWRVLIAAALNGLSARALEIACDYAKTRKAFGSPIGAFQAVSHPLADAATACEGAQLLGLEAGWALAGQLEQADALASMAFVAAAQSATELTKVAVHVHGGYGITKDYDIQLFHRRAKAWSLQLNDPRAEAIRLGKKLVSLRAAGHRLPPWQFESVAAREGYEFGLGARYRLFREQLTAFLASASVEPETTTGTAASEGFSAVFHKELGRAGYIALGWPEEYGGKESDAVELTIFAEELSNKTGHHNSPLSTSRLVAQTLIAVGSLVQKERYLPLIASGEVIVALGYTEPDGGSDVAAAKTRAVRDGAGWIINGQKMFTTSGDFADYVFLLTRTDSDKPKHRGLTMFLVPLKTRGVEVRPIETIGGVCTTASFYSDVYVSDDQRVGEVDGGWEVLSVALKLEHGGQSYHWLTARLLSEAVAVVERGALDSDSPFRERMANAAIAIETSKLLAYRSAWMRAQGLTMAGERGPMAKLHSSDSLVRAASELLDMLGSHAVLAPETVDRHAADVEQAFLVAPGTTTYGGTVEVMRSLIAERHLGLARSRQTVADGRGRLKT